MHQSRLTRRILECRHDGRPALIPFLPAGFPTKAAFWDHLQECDDSGAAVIEIGVPFSDPMADGPVVEEASQQSLAQDVNLDWILDELAEHRSGLQAEIVLMGYCNPFFRYGWDRLAARASEAGASGLIIPDLPLEESADLRQLLAEHNILLIPLIGLNTSRERMQAYAGVAQGYVYFVSVMGTTGARTTLPRQLLARLQEAKTIFDQPLALGFGLRSPDQLQELNQAVDAVVFGSALIEHIKAGGRAREFMARWTE